MPFSSENDCIVTVTHMGVMRVKEYNLDFSKPVPFVSQIKIPLVDMILPLLLFLYFLLSAIPTFLGQNVFPINQYFFVLSLLCFGEQSLYSLTRSLILMVR